jgi:hypothetical protein
MVVLEGYQLLPLDTITKAEMARIPSVVPILRGKVLTLGSAMGAWIEAVRRLVLSSVGTSTSFI